MTLDEKIGQLHGIHNEQFFRYVPGVKRLGIPPLTVTNGPAGVGPGGASPQPRATALPSPIALAATWDVDLAKRYGQLAGDESIRLGQTLLESPDVNLVRIPQSGRAFETFGEDPVLSGALAVAEIKGIQSAGVLANVKHFVANDQETNRGTINELIGERTLRELYLLPFEQAVKEGHAASVMCAYPRVNGAYNCENAPLLRDVLLHDWKYDGFITSDFGAVHSTEASLEAGLDLEMPTGKWFDEKLKQSVTNGKISMQLIDEALIRRFAKMMQLGLWKPLPPIKPIPVLEHGAESRRIAESSVVLLKNEGNLLPLDYRTLKSVALIGPYAVRTMTGGGGSSNVIPTYSIAPADGISAQIWLQRHVDVLDGHDIEAAASLAKKRDVAIIMLGDDEGEDHDHSIELSAEQNRLVEAVVAANPRTIVVLKSGAAMVMPWVDNVPALIEAWYPGQEDGNVVADVLFGNVNPSGRLPVSFPRSSADTLARFPEQYPGRNGKVNYAEGLEIGYRWFTAEHMQPQFPFGYGLSYTTFSFDNLRVHSAPDGSAEAVVTVKNTGGRNGAEVAQIYVSYPAIEEGNEPPVQLRGFAKVMLAAGASKQVRITLPARSFEYWSESTHAWKRPKGDFIVSAGGSSADLPLTTTLEMK